MTRPSCESILSFQASRETLTSGNPGGAEEESLRKAPMRERARVTNPAPVTNNRGIVGQVRDARHARAFPSQQRHEVSDLPVSFHGASDRFDFSRVPLIRLHDPMNLECSEPGGVGRHYPFSLVR